MVGTFVASKAGHDREAVYIIVAEDDEYVYLADGKYKTLEKPKKKNRKHLRLIQSMDAEDDMTQRLLKKQPVYNEEIKKAIGGIVCQKQM